MTRRVALGCYGTPTAIPGHCRDVDQLPDEDVSRVLRRTPLPTKKLCACMIAPPSESPSDFGIVRHRPGLWLDGAAGRPSEAFRPAMAKRAERLRT